MELFGIMLSVPIAFVLNVLYCLLLAKLISKYRAISRWLRVGSYMVLGLLTIEILLLITIGAVRSRGVLGRGFYVAHVILFFLCAPALANVLILRRKTNILSAWWVAAVICTFFAFFLVLLQYSVSESLYGIDGENGPYSFELLIPMRNQAYFPHAPVGFQSEFAPQPFVES